MRLPWTTQFDVEREKYGLRFSCEDCAHFDDAGEHCRHEWPNESHRREPEPPGVLDFCKEFELC